MTEKLNEKDVELLKGYFKNGIQYIGVNYSNLIDKHKETPAMIQELLRDKPKPIERFRNAMFVAFVGLIFTFSFGLVTYPNLSRYLAICIVFYGLFIVSLTIGYLYRGIQEEDIWLLFNFMIVLRKGKQEAEELREFLKKQEE